MFKIIIVLIVLFAASVAAQSSNWSSKCLEDEQKKRKEEFSIMYSPGEKSQNVMFERTSLYDIKSKSILIVFWRTDCLYCKNLLMLIDESLKKFDSKELQIIMVCLDDNGKRKDIYPFKKKHPNVLNLVDGNGYYGNIAKHYNVFGTPTMIILDQEYRFVKLPRNVVELKEIL